MWIRWYKKAYNCLSLPCSSLCSSSIRLLSYLAVMSVNQLHSIPRKCTLRTESMFVEGGGSWNHWCGTILAHAVESEQRFEWTRTKSTIWRDARVELVFENIQNIKNKDLFERHNYLLKPPESALNMLRVKSSNSIYCICNSPKNTECQQCFFLVFFSQAFILDQKLIYYVSYRILSMSIIFCL